MTDKIKPHVDVESLTHLTAAQKDRLRIWLRLQDTLNAGKFGDEMDAFFDPDMTYGNPSRPDLGSYKQWKVSPQELYKRFYPSHYRTISATAAGDDEIWVYCHHYGQHKGGPYMGVAPSGNDVNIEWFSIVTFRDDKILRIFSIADVLTMLIQVGKLSPALLPVDPYK